MATNISDQGSPATQKLIQAKRAALRGLTPEGLVEQEQKELEKHEQLGQILRQLGCTNVIATRNYLGYQAPRSSPYAPYHADWIKMAERRWEVQNSSERYQLLIAKALSNIGCTNIIVSSTQISYRPPWNHPMSQLRPDWLGLAMRNVSRRR